MKRLLSLLLAVLMVVSMASFAVMAEEGEEVVTGPLELTEQAGVFFEGENALEPVALGSTEQKVWEGDVDFAGVSEKAAWITPVPGGVGRMTVAMLLDNTVAAAESLVK